MSSKTVFKANKDRANSAGRAGFINCKGAYTGVFTSAELIEAGTGSKAIQFSFKDVSGATANYLKLWFENAKGEEIPSGTDMILAIVDILELPGIKDVPGKVDKWDASEKKVVSVDADIYPTVLDKPIGIVVHASEYKKGTGGVGSNLEIDMVFDAASRRTASEINNNEDPQEVEKILKRIKDTTLDTAEGEYEESLSGDSGQQEAFDDFDDGDFDI